MYQPLKQRKAFDEFFLESLLKTKYNPKRHMGMVAAHDLANVIKAWLVGLHHEAAPLIPRSLEWLQLAIARNELGHELRNFYRMQLVCGIATGLWLQDGRECLDEWDQARAFLEAAWDEYHLTTEDHHLEENSFEDYMAFCILSKQYKIGAEMHEKHIGKQEIPLSKVVKAEKFGYLLCRHYTNDEFDKKSLVEAGLKVLKRNLEGNWLGRGQVGRAALWLRIVYSIEQNNLTPLQILMKAYENMPNVIKPSFLMLH